MWHSAKKTLFCFQHEISGLVPSAEMRAPKWLFNKLPNNLGLCARGVLSHNWSRGGGGIIVKNSWKIIHDFRFETKLCLYFCLEVNIFASKRKMCLILLTFLNNLNDFASFRFVSLTAACWKCIFIAILPNVVGSEILLDNLVENSKDEWLFV